MTHQLSERDELTLRFIAMCDGMTYAAAQRNALAERCAEIREDEPWIDDTIDAILRYRKRGTNVRELRRAR